MNIYQYVPDPVANALSDRFDSNRHRIRAILSHVDPEDNVLDVGCVRHSLDDQAWRSPPAGEFLHADLCRHANHVVGLDLLDSEVERMNDGGYDVRLGDAEGFDLDEQFDVVVAGELIEHLANPGSFLERARRHLTADGRVVLTTPNPRRFHMLVWYLTGRKEIANREHTLWLDDYVIEELASRADLELRSTETYPPGYVFSSHLLYLAGLDTLGAGGFVFELEPTT